MLMIWRHLFQVNVYVQWMLTTKSVANPRKIYIQNIEFIRTKNALDLENDKILKAFGFKSIVLSVEGVEMYELQIDGELEKKKAQKSMTDGLENCGAQNPAKIINKNLAKIDFWFGCNNQHLCVERYVVQLFLSIFWFLSAVWSYNQCMLY